MEKPKKGKVYLKQGEIIFKQLPLWNNVQDSPGVEECIDFVLGWDERGFIKQTTPQRILQKITASYAKESYEFITNPPGASRWANRLGDLFFEFIKKTASESLSGKNVLEIGAGSTYIAERLVRESRVDKYLIMDPAIKDCSSLPNVEVLREYFKKESLKKIKIDFIICLNVLEYFDNPVQFLGDIGEALDESNGMAILVFPCIERHLMHGDYNMIVHEHLNYFTEKSITNILADCCFEVLDCKIDCNSFYFFVQRNRKNVMQQRKSKVEMDKIISRAAKKVSREFAQYIFIL